MEASISVNGTFLTVGQSMTVMVALEAFYMDLVNDGLGSDDHAVAMTEAYQARIDEIRELLIVSYGGTV